MIEILISNSKRNLLIIGERGVGKSTLIRLLAQKIIFEEVPPALKEKKIKEINFVSLLTGSKYRGQFEEKVLKLLQEFKSQNSILVLEDIHLMMSTGAARGTSLDLVNILKNFLRDNSIQVIATTDYEEYKNTIEKDNSLLGYFQKIMVNELSPEGTGKILKNLVNAVMTKDDMLVSNEIIEDIVESAKRDIRERKLPDSAIMLLERCIAKVKLKNISAPAGPLPDRGGGCGRSIVRYRQSSRNPYFHFFEKPPACPVGQYFEKDRRPGRGRRQNGFFGDHFQVGLRYKKEPAGRRFHVHRPDRSG